MKKYLLSLMMLLIALLLISCKDDNEDNNGDDNNIDTTENEKCNVSFYVDNELYDRKEIDKNSKVEELIISVDDGYYFYGWFTINNLKWDFKDTISEDLDLYGHISSLAKSDIIIEGNNNACEGTPEKYVAKNVKTGEIENVSWKVEISEGVDASSIATISEDGELTVISSGIVRVIGVSVETSDVYGAIIVSCHGKSAINRLMSIDINTDELYILLADEKKITYYLRFENDSDKALYTNKKVYFSSSDESIATVNEDGVITGIKEGTCIVSIISDYKGEDGNSPIKKDLTIVIYTPKAPTVWELPSNSTVNVGSVFSLNVTVGSKAEISDAIFTSSDPDVVTVYNNTTLIANKEGTVTITATSVADPTKVASVVVEVKYSIPNYGHEPIGLSLTGDSKMYVGYSQQLYLRLDNRLAGLSFSYISSDESVCVVNEQGYVTAVGEGTARIKVVANEDKRLYNNFRITCEIEPQHEQKPNMGGSEIVIMSSSDLIGEINPFLDNYDYIDKLYKQQAWREVEDEYNCIIKVVEYPFEEAATFDSISQWMNQKAMNSDLSFDLLYGPTILKSNLYSFSKDVTTYYEKYTNQMDCCLKDTVTHNLRICGISLGLNNTLSYDKLGLYYNYGLLKKLGLDDPATLFNEGKWTYSEFEKWVHEAQTKMGDGKFALGGHPYSYYTGLTNAAGVNIISTIGEVSIYTFRSKNAMTMMQKLVNEGCVSTTITWGNEKTESGNDFFDEGVLMTTGYMKLINNSQGWSVENGLDWEGNIEFGYVPFPYPDDVRKENTRISINELNAYYFINWNHYIQKDVEDVYRVMNDMFLKTKRYLEKDEKFNDEILYDYLRNYLSNDESITAMLYYDVARTIYDPVYEEYYSIYRTPSLHSSIDTMISKLIGENDEKPSLIDASVDVMFGGAEFYSVFKGLVSNYTLKYQKILFG